MLNRRNLFILLTAINLLSVFAVYHFSLDVFRDKPPITLDEERENVSRVSMHMQESVSLPSDVQMGWSDGPRPDLNLKAVMDDEIVMGGNASDYVRDLPGARASGYRQGGTEWISVPAEYDVQFIVSSKQAQRSIDWL